MSDPIRPYSKEAWLERQRLYRLQQAHRRRMVQIVGACIALIVGIILLTGALKNVPSDWDTRLKQTGKDWLRDR